MRHPVRLPAVDEYPEHVQPYIRAVGDAPDAVTVLEQQSTSLDGLRALSAAQGDHRYAPEKWTVKEVIGHITDTERIFAYRLLRVARGDDTPLPTFDENVYVERSGANTRSLADLIDEWLMVRGSTLALVRSLDDDALAHRGTVSGRPMSARAIACIIAGHAAHHMNLLRERYGIPIRTATSD